MTTNNSSPLFRDDFTGNLCQFCLGAPSCAWFNGKVVCKSCYVSRVKMPATEYPIPCRCMDCGATLRYLRGFCLPMSVFKLHLPQQQVVRWRNYVRSMLSGSLPLEESQR